MWQFVDYCSIHGLFRTEQINWHTLVPDLLFLNYKVDTPKRKLLAQDCAEKVGLIGEEIVLDTWRNGILHWQKVFSWVKNQSS